MARRKIAYAASLLFAVVLGGTAQSGDDAEKVAFNTHCRNCHSANKGDNRLGPSMHGVFGTRAGRISGFRAYSGALDGIVWDEVTLDRFIADPRSVAPGTTMIYPPVADAAERRKIIAFLKSQSGS